MRARGVTAILGALALCGAAPAAASADCAGADSMPAAGTVAAVDDASLCLLNVERTSRGLGALAANAQLAAAAVGHSQEMVASGTFSHDSPDGTPFDQRILAAGYRSLGGGWLVGENIAWGSGSLATPRQIVGAWMNSPEHRANILDGDFREIGVGVALGTPTGEGSGATYTTDFGARDGVVSVASRPPAQARPRVRRRARKRVRRHAVRRAGHHRRAKRHS